MREELYNNLYDEFGQGDFSQTHPNLLEPLMNYFGGARKEDINTVQGRIGSAILRGLKCIRM